MSRLTVETLRGFVPAVVTPFTEAGDIREDAFATMVDHMIGNGAQGICVAGDNGESWSLSLDERHRLTRIAVDRAAGRVPVITGVTAPSSIQTIAYANAAKEAGASGVLVMPQTYVMKATRDELFRRFENLAKGADIPIVAYNSPRRAVVELSIDDVEGLLDVAPIVGIKESNRDFGHLSRLLARLGQRIAVMVGPSYYILPGIGLGAAGFIATSPEFLGHTAGRLMGMGRAAPDDEYRRVHHQVSQLYEALMATGTWPSSLKAALNLLGLPAGVPRDPVLPLTGPALEKLRATMSALDLLPSS